MYLNIKKTDIALYINCWYSKPKIMVNFSTHISYSPFRFINKRRFFWYHFIFCRHACKLFSIILDHCSWWPCRPGGLILYISLKSGQCSASTWYHDLYLNMASSVFNVNTIDQYALSRWIFPFLVFPVFYSLHNVIFDSST